MKKTLCLAALLGLAAASPLAAQTAPAPERVGDFTVAVRRDPMDDSDRTSATVESTESTGAQPLQLTWRCVGNRYEAYVNNIPYTSDPAATVSWRFDSFPAMTGHWPAAQDAAHVGQEISGFTQLARRSSTLALRVNDSGGEVTASFRLEGASDALGRLTCLQGAHPRPAN